MDSTKDQQDKWLRTDTVSINRTVKALANAEIA